MGIGNGVCNRGFLRRIKHLTLAIRIHSPCRDAGNIYCYGLTSVVKVPMLRNYRSVKHEFLKHNQRFSVELRSVKNKLHLNLAGSAASCKCCCSGNGVAIRIQNRRTGLFIHQDTIYRVLMSLAQTLITHGIYQSYRALRVKELGVIFRILRTGLNSWCAEGQALFQVGNVRMRPCGSFIALVEVQILKNNERLPCHIAGVKCKLDVDRPRDPLRREYGFAGNLVTLRIQQRKPCHFIHQLTYNGIFMVRG